MLDVVQTAQMYRNRLTAELTRVDGFLRFAEQMKEITEREPAIGHRTAMERTAPQPAGATMAEQDQAAARPSPGRPADGQRSIFDGLDMDAPARARMA